MSDLTITKEDEQRDADGQGRYVARVAGREGEAELVFSHRGANLISADHTGAPESLRGTGVAAALVAQLVADARESGFSVIPACPYVRAQYGKHPEWQDVMSVAPGETP